MGRGWGSGSSYHVNKCYSTGRSRRRRLPSALQFDTLEDRRLLTGVTVDYIANTGVLTVDGLTSSANNISVHSVANNSVEIDLNGSYSTFTLLDDAAGSKAADFALSNGNSTLTIDTAAGQAPATTFNLNLGSANDTLNFALAAVNTGVQNVGINTGAGADVVTLGSIHINGNLQETGGAITVGSGALVTTSGGNISLTATGSNSALTANGNLLSNGGAIALQATGAVTVGTGVIVNSGAGTLTLAADVTAAGAGDDGVGTLSINAGATVTSSNSSASAITLRGADVNIDSSSNPAVVGATRTLGSTPSFTYPSSTGVDGPVAFVLDSAGNLYVANYYNNTVEEFAPGSSTVLATYSAGIDGPDALAFDANGNLYVANYDGDSVEKFAPGNTTPIAIYSTGTGSYPAALAFDSSGNLYVANAGDAANTVEKFAAGSTTLSATINVGLNPVALAFDASGNLYVADNGDNTVERVAPGATSPSATYNTGAKPVALAIDSSGNLYVANSNGDSVSKFAPGNTTAVATYVTGTGSAPNYLAFDASGNLYVADFGSDSVSEFAPGSTTAIATYSTGSGSGPFVLRFDGNGNLFVGNASNNTIAEFSLQGVTPMPTAGGVVIQSSIESRPMQIGGTNNAAVAGINLTSAELGRIFTTTSGTVTIGDTAQTGNLTFTSATPATTAGAALNVIQSAASAGQITINEASGTGLNGNGGRVSLTPGTGGIQAPLTASGTLLTTNGFAAGGMAIHLSLGFVPTFGTPITLVNDTATPAGSHPITGAFSNLAQGATLVLSYQGTPYTFRANYQGGDGNDLVLNYQVPPTVNVTDNSGAYTGAPYTATATVAGVGSQSTPAASLEGVTPSLTYYSGTSATGTPLSGAPSVVGTYSVLAGFAGSADYTSASASTTFTIGQSNLTISKTASSPYVIAGGSETYTLLVTNIGSAAAQNVILTDALPSGLIYASQSEPNTPGANFTLATSGNGIRDTLASLAAGASATITVVVTAGAGITNDTNIVNTATVSTTSSQPTNAINTSAATTTVVNAGAITLADPYVGGQTDLVVATSATGNDVILVSPAAHGAVTVTLNGKVVGTYTPTGRIVIYAGAGNDSLTVSTSETLPAYLYAGSGNDALTGGGGPNVLVGGPGRDVLTGGPGRNVEIGGSGLSRLYAGAPSTPGNLSGGSILIGGTTAYDHNDSALNAILQEWSNPSLPFATRVANLRGGVGAPALNSSTISLNRAADQLFGSTALDWFWSVPGTATTGVLNPSKGSQID